MEDIRAAHIEAEQEITAALRCMTRTMRTEQERRNVESLLTAMDALHRAKRHISALHPNGVLDP